MNYTKYKKNNLFILAAHGTVTAVYMSLPVYPDLYSAHVVYGALSVCSDGLRCSEHSGSDWSRFSTKYIKVK